MKLYTPFFLLFIISGSLSAQVMNDSSAVDLQINLLPGEKYLYSVSINQDIVQEILGDTLEINQQTVIDYSYLIGSNDGKLTQIEVTYNRIQIHSTAPQGNIEYDSDLKNNDTLPAINSLIGKSFNILIDTKGKIDKVEGFEDLTKNLKNIDWVKEFLSDSVLINSLDMNIYPDYPVTMGESWDKHNTMNLANLKLQNNLTYTLEGTSEDLAWLNVNGDITASNSDPNFEMDLSANQTGTIEADIKSGMISSSNIKMEMFATIKSGDLEIPLTIVTETRTEGRKL